MSFGVVFVNSHTMHVSRWTIYVVNEEFAMSKIIAITAIILCAGLAGCISGPDFYPIFNNKDLSGFSTVGSAQWVVEDNSIVGYQNPENPGGGYLITENRWKNFILALEFMVMPHEGNSGIIIREPQGGKGIPPKDGYEVQILDREDMMYATGSIRGVAPSLNPDHQFGWNSMKIIAYENWVQVYLNGKKTTEARLPTVQEGTIDFECYAGVENKYTRVHFRNLRITPLYEPPQELAGKFADGGTELASAKNYFSNEPKQTAAPKEKTASTQKTGNGGSSAPTNQQDIPPVPTPNSDGTAAQTPPADQKEEFTEVLKEVLPALLDQKLNALLDRKLSEKLAPLLAKKDQAPVDPTPQVTAAVTKLLDEKLAAFAAAQKPAADPTPQISAAMTKLLDAKLAPLAAAQKPAVDPTPQITAAVTKLIDEKVVPLLKPPAAVPAPAIEAAVGKLLDAKLAPIAAAQKPAVDPTPQITAAVTKLIDEKVVPLLKPPATVPAPAIEAAVGKLLDAKLAPLLTRKEPADPAPRIEAAVAKLLDAKLAPLLKEKPAPATAASVAKIVTEKLAPLLAKMPPADIQNTITSNITKVLENKVEVLKSRQDQLEAMIKTLQTAKFGEKQQKDLKKLTREFLDKLFEKNK